MQIKCSFLLLLGVHIQWVSTAPLEGKFKERDDSIALSSTITSTSPSISRTAEDPGINNESPTVTSDGVQSQSTFLSMTRSSLSSAMLTSTASTSSISAAATSLSVTDSTYNSATIPSGQLPLQPEITPGLAVGGVLLIATGALYTFIGIKNKWLQIFLSAGYLVSVATTVLILYVIDPPISNAVQGAYLVAVVLPGLIVGGCSLIFPEMTEGLGCLLGGFSFSMWLLVMKAGGLITSTSGKSIFIAALGIAGFALSFSHHTRTYGLIVGISFSGSTAIVLGIDCFSRAGLKEFWAYLWNLNQDLFPLGASTYPVTKGIRVEIAAIFVIFLAGLVSQSKVHKILQDRRAQRLAEQQENARILEEEELNVGRRIEDFNVAEKERWEKTYGDKLNSGDESARDSGVGDMESSKRGPSSTINSIRELDGKEVAMSDISSPTRSNSAGLIMLDEAGQDGRVTIRVARDIEPEVEKIEIGNSVPSCQLSHGSCKSQTIPSSEEVKNQGFSADGDDKINQSSQELSKRTVTPEVVPLPFNIPENQSEDDRSSVATFADEELAGNNQGLRQTSISGSALLRSLSARSKRESQSYLKEAISIEDLVIPYAKEDDRASSIAATVDDLSADEDMERRSVRSSFFGQESPLPDAGSRVEQSQQNEESLVLPTQTTAEPREDPSEEKITPSPVSPVSEDALDILASAMSGLRQSSELPPESGMTVATDIPNTHQSDDFSKEPIQQQPSLEPNQDTAANTESATGEKDEDKENKTISICKVEPSVTPAVEIKAITLTKDRLPSQLSRVVMSYRTNEWAKHLSHADSPQVDELTVSEDITEGLKAESAVPVDVEALQQTARNALPPSIPRSSSQTSIQTPGLTRSSSAQSNIIPFVTITEGSSVHGQDVLTRNSSQKSQGGLSVHRPLRKTSNPNIPEQIVESPGREITPSPRHLLRSNSPFGSSNTLMGKRETMIRNRSTYFPATKLSPHSMAPTSDPYQSSPSQFNSSTASQMGSETGSIRGSLYNHHHANTSSPSPIFTEDADDIPLSHRRELIRQSTHQPSIPPARTFNSHQPRRQSGALSPMAREQQLASWRASLTHDLQVQKQRDMDGLVRQRSVLWQGRRAEEMRRAVERKAREEREERWDERMRVDGAGIEVLHRRLLSRMQGEARRNDLSL
ncbi:hypothetical protein DSL72_000078 [Monilinia vaccinii-corymbosi]|uniref:TM7S3/TM198-like domain-containing protein n=1 Tax=Monilinia vaccinii-corymbosi TaxID=61207 RepID=A0A8A3P3K0_9HELO|nr:hypothetical protein DSL72_000078 [Monilinia vaccinii-corymbosi]